MNIKIKKLDNIEIFQLEGKLTHNNLEPIRAVKENIANSDSNNFFIDLTKVTDIDSAGIGIIISIYRSTVENKSSFALVKPTEKTFKALEIAGIERILKIYQSEEEAIEGIQG